MNKFFSLILSVMLAFAASAQTGVQYYGVPKGTTGYHGNLKVDSFFLPNAPYKATSIDTFLYLASDGKMYRGKVPASGGGGSSAWLDITGKPNTLAGYGITDATSNARSAISLTTTGTGAASYNGTSGVLNIPTTTGLDTTLASTLYLRKNAPAGTKQIIDAGNTNNSFGQANNQIQIGNTSLITDSGIHFSRGAALVLSQNYSASGANPMWLTMHAAGTGSANGIDVFGFGANGKVYPKIMFHSNFAEGNTTDKGVELVTQLAEGAPGLTEVSAYDFTTLSFYSATSGTYINGQNAFYAGGVRVPFSQSSSWLCRFRNWNSSAPINMFGVRTNGDIHVTGSIYNNMAIISTSATAALNVTVYKFTGGSGQTFTLPDPTGDNAGRVITLLNFGTDFLGIGGYSIYVDATTTINTVGYTYPDNEVSIISDGTNWILKP